MITEDTFTIERKEPGPSSYIVETSPGQFVICERKLDLDGIEGEFAQEVFDEYLQSNPPLRAAPFPDHMVMTVYSAQVSR